MNSFLTANPDLAEKLAGVVYAAPLMGMPVKKPPHVKYALQKLSDSFNELTLIGKADVHKMTR